MFRRFLVRVAACAVFGVAMAGCSALMGMGPLTVWICGTMWFASAMFATEPTS